MLRRTWNNGSYLYGSSIENDLKLPMGDVSGHIITNPLFMVVRNSLYGGIGENNAYELKSTKFGPQDFDKNYGGTTGTPNYLDSTSNIF